MPLVGTSIVASLTTATKYPVPWYLCTSVRNELRNVPEPTHLHSDVLNARLLQFTVFKIVQI